VRSLWRALRGRGLFRPGLLITDSASPAGEPARRGTVSLRLAAPLLFASGACALAYQAAWTREFRLIFGASTSASAAVVAVFMGGLGLGGWLIGPRADRRPNPLLLYARLEALVAITAAATPWFLALVRQAYIGLGGSTVMGETLGTLARLVLAGLVLLVPTVLAGGTLGAAARAVEHAGDQRRRATAVLYGVNTLGAVAGCLATTFFMLETFGTRRTLWLASLTNLLVAVTAGVIARSRRVRAVTVERLAGGEAAPASTHAASPIFVLTAATLVGFAFFLMELVWYRMLGPILGGTVYTFGLVLAMALAGIALGALAYPVVLGRREATLGLFATTCLAEAACLALPYVLGDRLALLALRLRPATGAGLWSHVEGWAVVTAIVILPAAAVAGAQFPLLIALLGAGRDGVARHVGLAYFWNTVGGIAGALAGGFGLLPVLTAPGCWRASALILAALALAALLATPQRRTAPLALTLAGAIALAVLLLGRPGPTAAWRHSGVGAGRVVSLAPAAGANGYRAWVNDSRRFVIWEREGIESSVAVQAFLGLAFVVNGKIDGNARNDAPTQVMGGLLGALLRPEIHRSLVIGLGTGSTAGWLADVPGMETTDVVELEPAILDVARMCAPVNRDALHNPRLHVTTGDAREVLMTGRRQYDLVFSEPSNPYRAGIASLFTREFYEAVDSRLSPGGLFLQWVQAYEVDERTISTILATLAAVFPEVEVWQVHNVDLVFVASRQPLRHRLSDLQARIAQEPFASGLRSAWRVTDASELLGAFVAGPALARHVLAAGEEINTDDRNPVEFSFARMVSQKNGFQVERMRAAAAALGAGRPVVDGDVDWDRAARHQVDIYTLAGDVYPLGAEASAEDRERAAAHGQYVGGQLTAAVETFRKQPRPPSGLTEIALFAEGLADAGDAEAAPYIRALAAASPAEADAATARLAFRRGLTVVAVDALVSAFTRYRSDPWPSQLAMGRALGLARQLTAVQPEVAARLDDALSEPFAVRALDEDRRLSRVLIARSGGHWDRCVAALAPLERSLPWRPDILRARAECYQRANDPRAAGASADLDAFVAAIPGVR
jgi:spermidine synthase